MAALKPRAVACLLGALLLSPDLPAETRTQSELLAAQLAELQNAHAELRQWTDQRLHALELQIEQLQSGVTSNPSEALAEQAASPYQLQGDLRLRYEYNSGGHQPERHRGALRGRIAAAVQLHPGWQLGARLTTGDADDPNSSDTTLGSFSDDLDVSLDRAYVQYTGPRASFWAGRFENPFTTTDMVWDGDVNLAGTAVSWHAPRHATLQFGLTGALAVIDEQATGSDSTLLGVQSHLRYHPSPDWGLDVDLAYYDYSIGSLDSADAGDLRQNQTNNGAYLADFDLLDAIVGVTMAAQTRWPLTITANVVRNLGATGGQDTGYRLAIATGRLSDVGSMNMGYAYGAAEADAVFAAYAQDNIPFGSNYRLHELWVNYRLTPAMDLNLTGYHYRPWRTVDTHDASTRLRLNWIMRF